MVGDGNHATKNWILSLFDQWRPRKATVTGVQPGGVELQVEGEDSPRPHLYLPSVDGLAIGDSGVLHPMKGIGAGQFIPTDHPTVSPYNLTNILPFQSVTDPISTTSINEAAPMWWDGVATGIARQVPLSIGTWEFDIRSSMKIRRSVNSGGVWLVTSVDGTSITHLDYHTAPHDAFVVMTNETRFTVVVASPRTIDIRIGFAGWLTAGTTSGYHPMLSGTYRKIG